MKRIRNILSPKQAYLTGYLVFAALLWLFFFFGLPYVLEFWEKNTLFRYSTEYFRYFDHDPLGVPFYLNTFFVQFNYYIGLGAAVHAGLFWLIAFLLNRSLSYAAGKRMFAPGWIVSGLMLPTVASYGLIWAVILLLILAGTWLWLPFKKPAARYVCQAMATAALMWMIREYTLFACLFYISIDVLAVRTQGKKIRHYIFWPGIVSALLCFGIGWFSWLPYRFVDFKYFMMLTRDASEIMMIPFSYFSPSKTVLCLLWIVLFYFTSFVYFKTLFFIKIRKKIYFGWLNYTISYVFPLTCMGICFAQSSSMQNFQKVDALMRDHHWEKALIELNHLWNSQLDPNDFSYDRILFNSQTKTALLATRKATSLLFTYPQPAFPLLFPLDLQNRPEPFVLSPYYLFAGGFSECLHINYDFITAHCISPNVLRSIILTDLIVDDTLPALRLIHFFKETLFYHNEAALYQNKMQRESLPTVIRGKTMLPPKNYAVASYIPDENSLREHSYNSENPFFYEYYLCVCLLRKQHALISEQISKIRRFYGKGNHFIAPRHIQEAILANFDYIPLHLAYPEQIEGISRETWHDYWQFVADNQNYQTKKLSFEKLQKKWGHTYWFYDCYLVSIPLVTDNIGEVN